MKNLKIIFITILFLPSIFVAQNVGIGVATPTEKLHVAGNLRLDNAFMPGNDAGITGQVLVSQGAGVAPVWQTPPWTNICPGATADYVQKWTGTELCNTIIQDNGVGVGVNAAPYTNTILYVYRPSTSYGAGFSGIYSYRSGTSGSSNGGSDWSRAGVDAAIKGYSLWGNRYSAAIAGYSFLDYDTSAALIGAKYDGSIFTGLAYQDAGGEEFALFSYGNIKVVNPNFDRFCLMTTTDSVLDVGSCYPLHADDGISLVLGGYSTIVDYVVDFDKGDTRGTAVGVGSIEYFVDGEATMFVSYDFSPVYDDSFSLGQSAHRWKEVWATNGTIQTSDINLKTNIQDMNYGLEEIMKINPIKYQWKPKEGAPYQDDNVYIGVSAQELLKIIPEAVVTEEWICTSENPLTYEKKPVKHYGIRYSALIPVLINAVKELNQKLEEANKRIEYLESQLQK